MVEFLCIFNFANCTAEADCSWSNKSIAASFSDQSASVGPLPTVFKPTAASNTVAEHLLVTTSKSRFLYPKLNTDLAFDTSVQDVLVV